MAETWFKDELETAELGDKRLNERFADVLHALTDRPHASTDVQVKKWKGRPSEAPAKQAQDKQQ